MFKPLLISGLLLVGLLASACSSGNGNSQVTIVSSLSPSSLTSQPPLSSAGPATVSASVTDDWPTYHRDLARSGFDPSFTFEKLPNRKWTSEVDGDVYAEPLIVGDRVLAATEKNWVYAFDFETGQTIWKVNLGLPVPLAELSCGDIDPSGVTSTPVADPAAGRLYVCARIEPDHHELFALDISNGATIFHRTVDPPGSEPRVQQQRAALTLSSARVYIGFGGLYGDCGAYHGWVVAAPVDGSSQILSYRVSAYNGAAVWAPSGPVVDSAGNIYVASGNAFSGSTFDYSNSLVRLSPDLSLADWWAPSNWKELDGGDVDLGSIGPSLLGGGLVFQSGKQGTGYLLQANQLGHVGGEKFSAAIGHGAFGGSAYAPPNLFVPTTGGLVALTIDSTPSFKVAWSGPDFEAGPPVIAGGTVLCLDIGSSTLYGFAIDKGAVLFKLKLGPVMHFATPALSRGCVLVAAGGQIVCLSQ